MTLINTEGLTLLGPGSEWLWTAISGIVLALTFVAIYRQLRLQRAAAAIEHAQALAREWLSEQMARNRLAALEALRDDKEVPAYANRFIGNFWERIGYLVRAGHMDLAVVDETFADVSTWWRLLAPTTRNVRLLTGNARIGEHFEWLAGALDEIDRKRGVPARDVARLLPHTLEENREAIRTAEELRAITMRPSSPSQAGLVRRADQPRRRGEHSRDKMA
jgi:hypothetical protein